MNRAIKNLKRCLNEEKNAGIQKYLKNLTPTENTDYSLWKAARKLKHPKNYIPPIRKINANWARTDKEKAETFAEHLQKVFETPQPYISEAEENKLINEENSTNQQSQYIASIKINEVRDIIKNLKV